MKIINVVGARPNFMKMAPIIEAMNKYLTQIQQLLVHTGQHYDEKMSKSFFNDLGMRKRPITCEVGSNIMVGNCKETILQEAFKVLNGELPKGSIPAKWDGKSAERIVEILLRQC